MARRRRHVEAVEHRVGSEIRLRRAKTSDLAAIASILNEQIATSPYVYTETPVTLGERRKWLTAHRSAKLPVLVAEYGDERGVIGWAALSPYRKASGYR